MEFRVSWDTHIRTHIHTGVTQVGKLVENACGVAARTADWRSEGGVPIPPIAP
jgi:hypothetical protein